MRLKKLIKTFIFEEDNRDRIILGANVRLNPTTNRVQLKEQTGYVYPTTADLYAKTWITYPKSCRQWLGFEVWGTHQKDETGTTVTSFGFRLCDGTDEYWWNGVSWEVNTTNWNTEAEVSENINEFPFQEQKIQIIVNLVTTDERYTPELEKIKVLYSSDIEFQEDIIYRSLIPFMKSEIRPIGIHVVDLTEDTDTINLNTDYALETPFNIVGIDAVFDHTSDPNHWADLYQSYNVDTKILTLSSTIDSGNSVWIRFIYEPLVAVMTDQEYFENDKVPSLIMSDIDMRNEKNIAQYDWVANKTQKTAVLVYGPKQKDIYINLRILTDTGKNQTGLADELRRFFENNTKIRSVGLDENYDLVMDVPYDARTYPGQKGLHTGNVVFKIVGVLFWTKTESDVFIVTKFNRTFIQL